MFTKFKCPFVFKLNFREKKCSCLEMTRQIKDIPFIPFIDGYVLS